MDDKIKINPNWDNLAKTAAAAKNAGMHYGDYQGLQYEKNRSLAEEAERQFRKYKARQKKQDNCDYCGGIIPKNSKFINCCCKECADKLEKRNDDDRKKGVFKSVPVKISSVNKCCIQCGKQLTGRQRLYCSDECKYLYNEEVIKKRSLQQADSKRPEERKKENRICQVCGKKIELLGKWVYCSAECTAIGRKMKRIQRKREAEEG